MSSNIRTKEDLLGIREVPADAYHGIHTLKAIGNFYISNNKISDILELVRDMVMVKKTAAMTSKELQTTFKSVTNVITAMCDGVLSNGKYVDQFPIDAYQSGAGTSANMNTNEVLANTGLELMDHQKDEYRYLNPNDYVNKCQPTNDAYPTGFRIIVYSSLIRLVDAIDQPRKGFERRAVESRDILRMDHTQLQDAVPMALGQEFRALSILLKEEVKSIQRTTELSLEVNLSATVVGTGLNTPKECSPLAVKKLAEVTGFPYIPAGDLIETASDYGAYVMVHGALERLAVKMLKIYNGLCLLSSGSCAGLNEINLPELQAGSSIMPAKVNPVILEVVNQVCLKIIGNDTTVTMATKAGQLQLSVMEPVIGQIMFEPIRILTDACHNLLEGYINGVTVSKEVCEGHVYNSTGIVTYLNPFIGYHNSGIIGRICTETGKSVREAVLECGPLTEAELDDISSVQSLMHPAHRAKHYTDENEQQSCKVV